VFQTKIYQKGILFIARKQYIIQRKKYITKRRRRKMTKDLFDSEHIKILRELNSDSRQKFSEIADKIGIPKSTVGTKYRRDMKGRVGATMLFDPTYLGLNFYLLEFAVNNEKDEKEIESMVKEHYAVMLAFRRRNYLIALLIGEEKDYNDFMKKIEGKCRIDREHYKPEPLKISKSFISEKIFGRIVKE